MPLSFYGKAMYDNEKMGTFTFNTSMQYLSSYAEFADWGALTHKNKISLHNYFARLEWQKGFTQNVFTSFALAFSSGAPNADEQLNYGSDIHHERRDMGYSSMDVRAQVEYSPSEIISLAMGGNYTADNYNIETIWSIFDRDYGEYAAGESVAVNGVNGDTAFSDMGIYTQIVLRPTENLSFTQGGMYDVHSIYGDLFNVRFGAVYKFSDQGYLKLLFGSAYNAPTPELLFAQPMYAGDVIGNPDLEPEFSRTFDLEVTPIGTEDFGASVGLFYNLVDGKMGFVYENGILRARNAANVSISGAEGGLRWSYRNFTVNWNLAYQYTRKREDTENAAPGGDVSLIDIVSFECPRLMSYSSINYAIPDAHLSFNFEQKYIGERNASQPNIALSGGELYKLGAYQTYNFTISTTRLKLFAVGETRFSLSVKNLTDERYIEPGYNGIDIPGIRRTIYVGAMQGF